MWPFCQHDFSQCTVHISLIKPVIIAGVRNRSNQLLYVYAIIPKLVFNQILFWDDVTGSEILKYLSIYNRVFYKMNLNIAQNLRNHFTTSLWRKSFCFQKKNQDFNVRLVKPTWKNIHATYMSRYTKYIFARICIIKIYFAYIFFMKDSLFVIIFICQNMSYISIPSKYIFVPQSFICCIIFYFHAWKNRNTDNSWWQQ